MIDRIPILRIRDLLLISIQADLHDILVEQLQSDILKELERKSAQGLVLDISALLVLDTYTARAFVHTAQMARLMGTRTIVSGMTPAIALTLTEMGFSASGFETALDLESACRRCRIPTLPICSTKRYSPLDASTLRSNLANPAPHSAPRPPVTLPLSEAADVRGSPPRPAASPSAAPSPSRRSPASSQASRTRRARILRLASESRWRSPCAPPRASRASPGTRATSACRPRDQPHPR